MSPDTEEKPIGEAKFHLPRTVTIRDILLIIGATASVMLAWGMLGTRLTTVENKVLTINDQTKEYKDLEKERNEQTKESLKELENRLSEVQKEINVLQVQIEHLKGKNNK